MSEEKTLPCCLACKWARPIIGVQVPSWLNSEPRIECGFHNFVVWEPRLHFCSHLTNAEGERHPVIDREQIVDGQMYVWVELEYRVLAAPDFKHVHHELEASSPFAKYARMTTVEKRTVYYRHQYPKWKAFKQQHSEEIELEDMYRKTRRRRQRLKPKDES